MLFYIFNFILLSLLSNKIEFLEIPRQFPQSDFQHLSINFTRPFIPETNETITRLLKTTEQLTQFNVSVQLILQLHLHLLCHTWWIDAVGSWITWWSSVSELLRDSLGRSLEIQSDINTGQVGDRWSPL